MTAKIERDHVTVRAEFGRDEIPPMRVRAAAMQQDEGALLRIATPIEIVEFEPIEFEEAVGRLRCDGSRLFVRHVGRILAGTDRRGTEMAEGWRRSRVGHLWISSAVASRPAFELIQSPAGDGVRKPECSA